MVERIAYTRAEWDAADWRDGDTPEDVAYMFDHDSADIWIVLIDYGWRPWRKAVPGLAGVNTAIDVLLEANPYSGGPEGVIDPAGHLWPWNRDWDVDPR